MAMMMDYPIEFKYAVLGLVCASNVPKRRMCELRIALFVAAANSSRRAECLMPFPSCFFNPKTKTKCFDDLLIHTRLIPELSTLKLESDIPDRTWQLIYWILTNPLTIDPELDSIKETAERWKTETGLSVYLNNNNSTYLFRVRTPYPKKTFVEGKAAHGTFFAFHGSNFENFHSIIHRGLVSALNKRSAYGVGSYLSSSLMVSKSYSDLGDGWSKSILGNRFKCIAICEVVNDPRIKKQDVGSDITYFVCAHDELIQLSHLILFCSGKTANCGYAFSN